MGEARRRGTFEERKAVAISRQKVRAELKRTREAEIKANKTPEQRQEEHKAKMGTLELMLLLGMSGWCISPTPYLTKYKGRG